MNQRLLAVLILSGLILSLTGCTRRDGNTYSPQSLGRIGRADTGVVVHVRLVNVEGTTRTGTMLGGITGAALGNDLGRGNSDAIEILSTAGGAIIGGMAGAGTEEMITRTTAYEYIVEMDSGHKETIVQRDRQPISHGARVILLSGPDAKIIPDPGV